jgi:hypothetical protein
MQGHAACVPATQPRRNEGQTRPAKAGCRAMDRLPSRSQRTAARAAPHTACAHCGTRCPGRQRWRARRADRITASARSCRLRRETYVGGRTSGGRRSEGDGRQDNSSFAKQTPTQAATRRASNKTRSRGAYHPSRSVNRWTLQLRAHAEAVAATQRRGRRTGRGASGRERRAQPGFQRDVTHAASGELGAGEQWRHTTASAADGRDGALVEGLDAVRWVGGVGTTHCPAPPQQPEATSQRSRTPHQPSEAN